MARLTPSTRSSSITMTSGAHTASVDIPAGATSAVIGFLYYNDTGPESTVRPTSVSLDGQSATFIDGAGDPATAWVALFRATGFATGAGKTLAYTLSATGSYLLMDLAIEYQDGTPTWGAHGANATSGATATTAALANSSGDLILSAYAGTITNGSPTMGAGQSKLDETNDGVSGGIFYGFTTETGTGSSDAQSCTGGIPAIASIVVTISAPTTIAWIRA